MGLFALINMTIFIKKRKGFTVYKPRDGGNTKRYVLKTDELSFYELMEFPKTGTQESSIVGASETLDDALKGLSL